MSNQDEANRQQLKHWLLAMALALAVLLFSKPKQRDSTPKQATLFSLYHFSLVGKRKK